jgi:hypothetical protein
MRRFPILLMLVSLSAAIGASGRTLSSAEIDAAIRAGDVSKRYFVRPRSLVLGMFSTPFSRVAMAAQDARRQYRPFTAADVTDEMLAPELHVIVPAYSASAGDIRNVDAVVIAPRGSKDDSAVLQPIRSEPMRDEFRTLLGATFEGRGLIAVFPLDVLREGNELRIVYDIGWNCGAWRGRDCRVQFTEKLLKNLR